MDITYFGTNTGPGPQQVRIRHGGGNTTFLKQRIVLHSPDGFQWGYGGSGPADLALNMLLDYLVRTHRKRSRNVALDLYQSFKLEFIACQGEELIVTGNDIEKWFVSGEVLQRLSRG